jgi:hypothetical protein
VASIVKKIKSIMQTLAACPECAARRCRMKIAIAKLRKQEWLDPECEKFVSKAEWEKHRAAQAALFPSAGAAGVDSPLREGAGAEQAGKARPAHRKSRVAADQGGKAGKDASVRVLRGEKVPAVRSGRNSARKGR